VAAVSTVAANAAASNVTQEASITSINTRVGLVETLNTQQSSSIDSLEGNVSSINTRVGLVETLNTQQSASIDSLETLAGTLATKTSVDTRVSIIESVNTLQNASIDSLETLAGSAIQNLAKYSAPSAVVAPATPVTITLITPIQGGGVSATGNVIEVTINGLGLQYSLTPGNGTYQVTGATTVVFQVAYALDATDVIEVAYAAD
jgi:hypothetical protein